MIISTMTEFNLSLNKLPEQIRIDVSQRVADGVRSGKTETEPYILRQFKYVSECLELLEKC